MPARIAMAEIGFENGAVCIDASIIGKGLGLEAAAVPALMHEGTITGVCERGIDEDAGRFRLTSFYRNRRFRLTINETGHIVRRSTVDFGDRPLPTLMRRPGAQTHVGLLGAGLR